MEIQWQPIETAPLDQMVILVADGFIGYGKYGYDGDWWIGEHWSGEFRRAGANNRKWIPMPYTVPLKHVSRATLPA